MVRGFTVVFCCFVSIFRVLSACEPDILIIETADLVIGKRFAKIVSIGLF